MLRAQLDALELLCRETDIDGIRALLAELVDGYGPANRFRSVFSAYLYVNCHQRLQFT